MKWYALDVLGDVDDPMYDEYVFVEDAPDLGGAKWTRLKKGRALGSTYPDPPLAATLQASAARGGLAEPSFIANTNRLLAVRGEFADLIEDACTGELERLPFTLLDARGATKSTDYVFLNPIGTFDCVDRERSSLVVRPDGKIGRVESIALAGSKLDGAPDLLRPDEAPGWFVFSARLVASLSEAGATNFRFDELEIV